MYRVLSRGPNLLEPFSLGFFFSVPSAFPTVLCLILGFPSFQVFGGGGDDGCTYLYICCYPGILLISLYVGFVFFFFPWNSLIVCSGYVERSLLIKLILLTKWICFCICIVRLESLGVGFFWWDGNKRIKGKMKFCRGSERRLALWFVLIVYFSQKL